MACHRSRAVVCVCVSVVALPGVYPGVRSWSGEACEGPACWQQLESVSRCEFSSVLFGSLAALPLVPNTAVACPTEQRGMCVCERGRVPFLFICVVVQFNDVATQMNQFGAVACWSLVQSVCCWIPAFLLYFASTFPPQMLGVFFSQVTRQSFYFPFVSHFLSPAVCLPCDSLALCEGHGQTT